VENLWPIELITPLPKVASDWDVFEAQAVAIEQASMGLVQGEVRHREAMIGRSSSMFLFPTAQPTKGYEFMAIRSAGEDFPLAVEVFHLGEAKRIWRALNASELKRVLRKIFAHEETSRIVRSLAQESMRIHPNVSSGELDPLAGNTTIGPDAENELPPKNSTREPSRPIAVGGLLREGDVSFATINLLGVSGYMKEDELKRLVMKPDTKGSAISKLNGRYVVAVSFLDSVRMTLSTDELKLLQDKVKLAL